MYVMLFEDYQSVIIFDKKKNDTDINQSLFNQQYLNRSFFKLNIISFVLHVLIFSILYLYKDEILNFPMLSIFVIGFVMLIYRSWRQVLYLNCYGQDLLVYRGDRLIGFAVVQNIITSVLFGMLFITIYFLSLVLFSQVYFIVIFTLIGFVYFFSFSELSSVSLSLGTGIIINRKSFFKNINSYRDLFGSNLYLLSLVKLMYLSSIIFLILFDLHPVYMLIVTILYLPLNIRNEKVHSSSLFMKIRGKIRILSPTQLPRISTDSLIRKSTTIPSIISPSSNQLSSNTKTGKIRSYTDSLSKPSLTTNLTPYAVNSINRIVDSIKQEEYQLNDASTSCRSCGALSDTELCANCDFSVKFDIQF